MNHTTADTRKTPPANGALPRHRRLHEIRLLAGIAIASGGASVLLSDLIHLVPSLG